LNGISRRLRVLPFRKITDGFVQNTAQFFRADTGTAGGENGRKRSAIRAGLAGGIVKLKLDLAGPRKRPRLVVAAPVIQADP